MTVHPLFADDCPRCSGPLTAITPLEWACENCQVIYEPCGNYLILRHLSLLEADDTATPSDDLITH